MRPGVEAVPGVVRSGVEALPGEAWLTLMRRGGSMRPGVEALPGEAWVETISHKPWIDEDRSQ